MKRHFAAKLAAILVCSICITGSGAKPVRALGNIGDVLGSLLGGSGIEKDEEARRLGTVTRGDVSIHLDDTPEQIHEALGEPEDSRTMGDTYTETYAGLRVFYRDYGKMSKKLSWVKSTTKEEGVDYRAAMISIMPPKEITDLLNPYCTADGFKINDFSTALKECSTVYPYGPGQDPEKTDPDKSNFLQIYYDGKYYSPVDWEKEQFDMKTGGDKDAYSKSTMGVVKIWYTMDFEKDQIERIDVGDEMMARNMQ